ncbi:hypothetical protein [Sinorhizobium sp. BG8]|uniref:hypothetical protein n=1 Tax=Sinorhizobium sp. BG8 TaxID=2613773 RepID=UPI00193D7BB8|nr:hypothetical protein [Sinorhizobium sp. BG8]QRM55143.1 hypothetical protein F3Y30_11815 [Sinorhizobium sp. BG8]
MDALFQRLARASRVVVETVHGDAVTVVPLARSGGVNGPTTPDHASAYETVACFFENTLAENEASIRPLTGEGRMLNASPAISASIRIVPGQPLTAECALVRVRDGQTFRITSFKPDGVGTVLAAVTKIQPLGESV